MARRKVVKAAAVVAPDDPDAAPPPELLRFRPSQPAPIGEHGRPEPWRVRWEAAEFAAWLRVRSAWRDTHTAPLPGLFARERVALTALNLPRALVEAERERPLNRSNGDS